MQKFDWKTLYFVLASMLGLGMLVIGLATASNTLLTQYVFTPKTQMRAYPPEPMLSVPSVARDLSKEELQDDLTEEQKAALEQWRKDYASWQEEQKNYDWEAENRKRSLAFAVSMIIAGGPVFLIHAPFVFKRSA